MMMIKNRILSLQLLHMFINIVLPLLCMKKSTVLGFVGSVVVVEDGNTTAAAAAAATTTTTKCIERERQALLLFKESLVDSYGRLSSWGSEEDKKECCKWSGVHCSNRNGHVIVLNLSAPYYSKFDNYSSLGGKISPSLLQLRHLRYLDLSYNDFGSTPIPNFVGSLPKLKHLDLRWLSHLSSLTFLSLAGNQLEGEIPISVSFRNLCNLKTLDLSRNNLNGTLSSLANDLACAEALLESLILTGNTLTGSLNDDITRFSSLRKLCLGENRLNGFLPNALRNLSVLQHLDVSFNSLRGVISEAHFLNLAKLKYLDLSVNTFSLELSSQWISPFQLDTIILASCALGPRFPRWLQTQSKISHLNLSNCGISDTIPMWFWNQSRLQFLDLSSNKLRGMLPADLSLKFVGYPLIDLSSNYFVGPVSRLPSHLAILNLSQNKFSGRLSFLCSITNWTTFLDLSENLFAGGLPGCLEYFQELIILNLAHNKLSGEIPNFASSLSHLESLVLRNNSFFGEFPSTFRHCPRLRIIDLGENKLSGNIPAWIGENKSELYILSLRSNKFNGNIPLQLCHLTKLQILDLSLNSLSGPIPRCFDNSTALVDYRHSWIQRDSSSSYIENNYANSLYIMWKGRLSLFKKGLFLLLAIDLSSNKLTGEIPEEITNLEGLLSLNLSKNQLYGVIPPKIGQMRMLESLDLSRNKFSGQIPLGMAELLFLSVLDLSYNNLSGRIPLSAQMQGFYASVYTGNSGLCGIPLEYKCHNEGAIVGGGNELGRWFCMVIALGFSTGFWELVAQYVLFNHHSRYIPVSSF